MYHVRVEVDATVRDERPIIVADGLLGDDSVDIDTGGEVFDSITVASAIAKADCTRMGNVMAGYATCCGRRQVLMQIS